MNKNFCFGGGWEEVVGGWLLQEVHTVVGGISQDVIPLCVHNL